MKKAKLVNIRVTAKMIEAIKGYGLNVSEICRKAIENELEMAFCKQNKEYVQFDNLKYAPFGINKSTDNGINFVMSVKKPKTEFLICVGNEDYNAAAPIKIKDWKKLKESIDSMIEKAK